jgi:hypothetical protein
MMLTTACPAALHHNLLRTCFPTQTASVRALIVELSVRRRTRGRRATAVAVAGSSPAFFLGLSIPTQPIFLVLTAKTATAAEGGGRVDHASRPSGNGLHLHVRVTTVVSILRPIRMGLPHRPQPVPPRHRSRYRAGAPRAPHTPTMTPPTHFPPAAATTTLASAAAAVAAGAAVVAA